MDEHLIPDVRFDLASALDDFEKFLAGRLVVSVVSINHVDQGAAVLDVLHRVRLQHVVAWEVYHIEFDVVVVRDSLGLHIPSRQQEEGLVWRHLLEDHFRNGCLARPTKFQYKKGLAISLLCMHACALLTWACP